MRTTAAVIEFGTSKIVTVLAESGSFSRCEILGSGTVPYDGYSDGTWNKPIELTDKVKQSIAAAELEGKSHIKEIFVSVPSEFFNVCLADAEVPLKDPDGRVSDDDMDAVHDAAADSLSLGDRRSCIVHRSPAWFCLDSGKKTMTPTQSNRKGKVLRGLTSFIVADPQFISEMRELFRTLGIQVRGFVAPALGEAILYVPTEERDRTAALIDVGYLNTEFSVLEGDAITYHAVIPLGGGFITAAIASSLSIHMAPAEKCKREYPLISDELDSRPDYTVDDDGERTTFPGEFVSRAVQGTLDDLIADLKAVIKDAGASLGDHATIYLTGGGLAPMRGAARFLSDALEYSVKEVRAPSGKLGGYLYTSALGMIDQVFDSLEPRTVQGNSLPGKLVGEVKNLFRRADTSKEETQNTDNRN